MSLTLDPLIAEARLRARERQARIARFTAATLILGVTLAGAVFLQRHLFIENHSALLDMSYASVRPWWLYAATVALCVLGAAGAASLLVTARRPVLIGYAAASVLFIAAGTAVLADERLLGRISAGIVMLLLGVIAAALALTLRSRYEQRGREPGVGSPA